MDRLGEGERQVRLGQDRLAIKKQRKHGMVVNYHGKKFYNIGPR